MKLERATEKDIPILMEVEAFSAGGKTYSVNDKEDWETDIKTGVVYIIKENSKLTGLVSYEIETEEIAYISGLVILPAFRGKGVAKEAMKAILKELDKSRKIYLVTHPDNASSVGLYKSLGFVEGERKENYFGDGEPRIEMILNR